MHRVFARTDALHSSSFRRESELRESTWFKGAWATDLLYAQIESEWRPEHAG
jgi:RimJ/RimL family protein N-acetyltransferase